jgi:membrane protease YdiL (CAAX protease family)
VGDVAVGGVTNGDAQRAPEATPGKLLAWATVVVVLSSLSFLGNLTSEPEENFIYKWSLGIGTLVQDGIILGIVYLIVRGSFVEAVAWRPPVAIGRAVGLGAATLVGVYVLTGALAPILQPGEEQGLVPEEVDGSRIAPLVFNSILIVTFVPFVEELFFRGAGVWVLRRYGTAAAIAGSGIAFALVHGLLEGLPIFTAFGAALAYLRLRTASIFPCIAVHSVFNALAIAAALVSAE